MGPWGLEVKGLFFQEHIDPRPLHGVKLNEFSFKKKYYYFLWYPLGVHGIPVKYRERKRAKKKKHETFQKTKHPQDPKILTRGKHSSNYTKNFFTGFATTKFIVGNELVTLVMKMGTANRLRSILWTWYRDSNPGLSHRPIFFSFALQFHITKLHLFVSYYCHLS